MVLEVLLVHAALILGASSPKNGAQSLLLCWCTFFWYSEQKNEVCCVLIFGAPDNIYQLQSSTKKLAPNTIFGTSDDSGIKGYTGHRYPRALNELRSYMYAYNLARVA